MTKIKRAILSCYDKTGLVELARLLYEMDVELISTSGTLQTLRDAGIYTVSIADYTGFPELMNGRVKSLHLKVHGGLLGIRDSRLHEEQRQEHGIEWIDMVVVNLQPVDEIVRRAGATPAEVLDHVDIGGTAMLRSAAKNFRFVTPVTQPRRYAALMHEIRANEGSVSYALRYRLAQEAFATTAAYDQAITSYLMQHEPPVE